MAAALWVLSPPCRIAPTSARGKYPNRTCSCPFLPLLPRQLYAAANSTASAIAAGGAAGSANATDPDTGAITSMAQSAFRALTPDLMDKFFPSIFKYATGSWDLHSGLDQVML